MDELFDPFGPPGRPHIIRWQGPDEALILADDGTALARLRMPPGAAPTLAVLREPAGAAAREMLIGALLWATEERALRSVRLGWAV